jgi:two-component system invasion response regulator UvrY
MEVRVPEELSEREGWVFKGIAQGKPIKDIAKHYYLSPSTVSTYRARILKKLNLQHNAELVQLAYRLNGK